MTWTAAKNGDIEARNRIVLEHMDLVRSEARKMAGTQSRYLEFDNLTADGIVGLFDAVERYEPARGVPFEAFARSRIRGEMLEGLRRAGSWGGPGTIRERRRAARSVSVVDEELAGRLGRAPTTDELAKELGWERRDVELAQAFAFESEVLRLDFPAGGGVADPADDGFDDPSLVSTLPERGVDVEGEINIAHLSELLIEAQERLPERERVVYALYYFQHLKFVEIAELLEVSVARVSQVHTDAVTHIKEHLLTGRRRR